MNREEVKALLPIMQAFADGKEIEGIYKGIKEPWFNVEDMVFDGGTIYRIKPSPKYRPFKDAEECWNEMLRHQPFGWVKNGSTFLAISLIGSSLLIGKDDVTTTYKDVFNGCTFADGAVFGVREETK